MSILDRVIRFHPRIAYKKHGAELEGRLEGKSNMPLATQQSQLLSTYITEFFNLITTHHIEIKNAYAGSKLTSSV